VCNAPYGVRVGAGGDLDRLFRELGALARSKLGGWTIAVLVADADTARAAGLPWRRALKFQNGGIPVELLVAQQR
jgi:23S rRNA G2445 N2-methylase RlmL